MVVECGVCGKEYNISDSWVLNQGCYMSSKKLACPYCKEAEKREIRKLSGVSR